MKYIIDRFHFREENTFSWAKERRGVASHGSGKDEGDGDPEAMDFTLLPILAVLCVFGGVGTCVYKKYVRQNDAGSGQ